MFYLLISPQKLNQNLKILLKVCLYQFAAWYDYKAVKCPKTHNNCYELLNQLGFIHLRTEEKVINTANIKCIDNDSTESYFPLTGLLNEDNSAIINKYWPPNILPLFTTLPKNL
jgi:hypothetical protein